MRSMFRLDGLLAGIAIGACVAASAMAGYSLKAFVIAGGGGSLSAPGYSCTMTIGQAVASAPAASTGGGYEFRSGFWVMVNGCPADLNGDGQVDDGDFVLFASAYDRLMCEDPAMPAGCPADFNRDGLVDDADFVTFAEAYNLLMCP
ncbi:MAG: hypothetical protein U0573_03255 [Phycisphaerales bacterium]|nr:hypothetical protein [Planctomycetota bacterium]